MPPGNARQRASRPRGVALLLVLVAVTAMSLAILVPLRSERTAMQRERERELLFIGDQFRDAIGRYVAATPGAVPQYPKTLAELLEDRRFPEVRRHLRRLYADPMTGTADWTLLKEQGAIVGVASSSQRVPLKRSGFALADIDFADAGSYADWKFVHRQPSSAPVAAPAVPPAPDATGQPHPPGASPLPAPGDGDKRSQCGRAYSSQLNRCAIDPATALACRAQARTEFLACLRG